MKISSLQVGRGIAAVLVVLYHVTVYGADEFNYLLFNNLFAFGYAGVDFFFVLSGFIIFYVHARDIGHRDKLKAYFSKRLIRVYPIYWAVTTAKLIAIFLIPSIAKDYEKYLSVIIYSYLLIPQVNHPIVAPAWTLSYEMSFYLLFGMAIWLGHRLAKVLLITWVSIILIYTLARTFNLIERPDSHLILFLLNERNLEFTLGLLSAYIVMQHKLAYQELMLVLGCVLFGISGWYAVSIHDQVSSYTLLFGIPALLIVVSSVSLERKRNITFPAWLVFIGDASYSIYLTHSMFINLSNLVLQRLEKVVEIPPGLALPGVALAAVLGGCLVYFYVERPLLAFLRHVFTQKKPLDAAPSH